MKSHCNWLQLGTLTKTQKNKKIAIWYSAYAEEQKRVVSVRICVVFCCFYLVLSSTKLKMGFWTFMYRLRHNVARVYQFKQCVEVIPLVLTMTNNHKLGFDRIQARSISPIQSKSETSCLPACLPACQSPLVCGIPTPSRLWAQHLRSTKLRKLPSSITDELFLLLPPPVAVWTGWRCTVWHPCFSWEHTTKSWN